MRRIIAKTWNLTTVLICTVLLTSCSSKQIMEWAPPEGDISITIVGPVYLDNKGSDFQISMVMLRTLRALVTNPQEILKPPNRSYTITLLDWTSGQEEIWRRWQQSKIQWTKENDRAEEAESSVSSQEIEQDEEKGMEEQILNPRKIIFSVKRMPSNDNIVIIEGFRSISMADETEVNRFYIPVDTKKAPVEKQFKEILIRLITTGDFSSFGFGKMSFSLIKGGCFEMMETTGPGKSKINAGREECLDDFYLGRYPITVKQWHSIMRRKYNAEKSLLPMTKVNWNDVQLFIERLNEQTDRHYRLPTEVEWEYACRKGPVAESVAGNQIIKGNFYFKNRHDRWDGLSDVGNFPIGRNGLFDMNGNVWEFVEGGYLRNEHTFLIKQWLDSLFYEQSQRITRGGSFDDPIPESACSLRNHQSSGLRLVDVGFRLALDP